MDYRELLKKSLKELNTADYLSAKTMTYIKDHKIFINILTHLNYAIDLGMKAWMENQYKNKRIRILPSSEALVRQMFFDICTEKLDVTTSEKWIIREMKAVTSAHKSEQMEFKRGEEYVLVLPDYKTVIVNANTVKRYLSTARSIINKIESGLDG